MTSMRRVDLRSILANPDLRRELMVPTLQATQARERIETTQEQAERAYYVVTEGERTSFFDLAPFEGGRTKFERREEMFVLALRNDAVNVRFDIARRDFKAVDASPLAFRRIAHISHVFKEALPLDPAWGIARQGKATGEDSRWLREWWEVVGRPGWVPFAKGGEFCRFYYDIDLVIDWREENRCALKNTGNGLPSLELYFKPGLTWPLRTQKGFNMRVMPEGCVFGHKGPAIFPAKEENAYYILAVANSRMSTYLLDALTSFGSWEVGIIKKLPIPTPSAEQRLKISEAARIIHDAKSAWDEGNEVSTRFAMPWVLHSSVQLVAPSIPERLAHLAAFEAGEEARIQQKYAELNDEVYRLYGIPDTTRAIIEETLGKRPPEILWPQMEGQSFEQKRLEHVLLLLSYAVKRVVEADEDGVVPFGSIVGEPSLLERVLEELHSFFPDRDIGQVETEIVNELNESVKGNRRKQDLAEWLENAFFEYHSSLYKSRPIFWHIASSQRPAPFAFGALVHYHKFNRDRIAKLRSQYLREAIETFRREAARADKEGRTGDRIAWQARLEEAQELDRRLQQVQEGNGDFGIKTPWKTPEERPVGWDPDLDDGVKVNIEPLQKAGVLRIAKVVG